MVCWVSMWGLHPTKLPLSHKIIPFCEVKAHIRPLSHKSGVKAQNPLFPQNTNLPYLTKPIYTGLKYQTTLKHHLAFSSQTLYTGLMDWSQLAFSSQNPIHGPIVPKNSKIPTCLYLTKPIYWPNIPNCSKISSSLYLTNPMYWTHGLVSTCL